MPSLDTTPGPGRFFDSGVFSEEEGILMLQTLAVCREAGDALADLLYALKLVGCHSSLKEEEEKICVVGSLEIE